MLQTWTLENNFLGFRNIDDHCRRVSSRRPCELDMNDTALWAQHNAAVTHRVRSKRHDRFTEMSIHNSGKTKSPTIVVQQVTPKDLNVGTNTSLRDRYGMRVIYI